MLEIVLLAVYVSLLCVLLSYSLLQLTLALHYLRHLRQRAARRPSRRTLDDASRPFVTIQLPVYNEMYVVERLIDQVARMDYPKDRFEIQVLDDSTDETVEIAARKVREYSARGFRIRHLRRADRSGYKAGALREGLSHARGEFIAIFDADFLPEPDFLRLTLPHFDDPNVGAVQTRWAHLNKDYSLLTRVQAFFLDAHFTVEQKGRNTRGYFMNFNGTAGVWRARTIHDAGGWRADTLTEDLDLSYRAQLNGWRFVYLDDVLSPAELPADIRSFKSQQFRWMKGGAENARRLLTRILRSRLPLPVKLHACSHLLSSSVYVVIFLAIVLSVPLSMVKNTYIRVEYVHYGTPFLLSNLALAVVYFAPRKDDFKRPRGFLEYLFLMPTFLIITMGLSLHNALAVVRGYLRERTPFVRTPKFNIRTVKDRWWDKRYVSRSIDPVTLLESLLAVYFFSGMLYGVSKDDFSLVPVQLMAFLGFCSVISYSVRQLRSRR